MYVATGTIPSATLTLESFENIFEDAASATLHDEDTRRSRASAFLAAVPQAMFFEKVAIQTTLLVFSEATLEDTDYTALRSYWNDLFNP